MNLKIGGIYKHKDVNAVSVILAVDDNLVFGYCLLTNAFSHTSIIEEMMERVEKLGVLDTMYWYDNEGKMKDTFDGYLGEMPRKNLEKMLEFDDEVEYSRLKGFLNYNLKKQTCQNCKYLLQETDYTGTEICFVCAKDKHLIGYFEDMSEETCEEYEDVKTVDDIAEEMREMKTYSFEKF